MAQVPLKIIKMTLNDLPEVMIIERMAYRAPWPEDAYRQELCNEQAYFELVKYRGKIIGYSGTWYMAGEAHIGTIVSHPLVRRKGIGELLLVSIISRAYKLSVNVATLEVRPSNQPARSLYTKYGFQEVDRHKRYYPDTGEDAIIMTTPPVVSHAYRALFQALTGKLFNRLIVFNLDESR